MDAIKLLETKYSLLNIKYMELKDKFEKRPPREQDIELISRLQDELLLKEKQCKEAQENMERFRNMLINNEENYNKYFNSNPKTGSLNLIKPKENAGSKDKITVN
jgi:hypothetical protein